MIGFEGKLPMLAATFKRLVPATTVASQRLSPVPSPTSTPPVAAQHEGGIDTDATTILVHGLTWADTVDLTFSTE